VGSHLATKGNNTTPGNPLEMITMAECRLRVRVRLAVPPDSFGQRYGEMTAWLDGNCGSDGLVMTSSAMRGELNDAVRSISARPRLRARLSPAGALYPRSRRRAACSVCATMSRLYVPLRFSNCLCDDASEKEPKEKTVFSTYRTN
jgi:hypothetical protein